MKNIAFVFAAVGLLAGCNNDLNTPILISDILWSTTPQCSEPGFHIAVMEDWSNQEILDSCISDDPNYIYTNNYYQCWIKTRNGNIIQVIANPERNSVAFLFTNSYYIQQAGSTLCTNK